MLCASVCAMAYRGTRLSLWVCAVSFLTAPAQAQSGSWTSCEDYCQNVTGTPTWEVRGGPVLGVCSGAAVQALHGQDTCVDAETTWSDYGEDCYTSGKKVCCCGESALSSFAEQFAPQAGLENYTSCEHYCLNGTGETTWEVSGGPVLGVCSGAATQAVLGDDRCVDALTEWSDYGEECSTSGKKVCCCGETWMVGDARPMTSTFFAATALFVALAISWGPTTCNE